MAGRRDEADAELAGAKAAKPKPADWMIKTTEEQLGTLGKLLSQWCNP